MKNIFRIACTLVLSFLLISCFGDKNTVIGQDLGDTDFVNKNFAGNKVAFSALPKNMCSYINESKLKEFYPDSKKILFDEGKTFASKNCRFLVYMSDEKFDFLSGTIFATENIIAEGEDWKQTWELKKKMSKSSTYVSGLGEAAIWIGKKRELSVKMDGYIITITVPGSPFKKEELAKKRDYKNIAIEIAKSTGLF